MEILTRLQLAYLCYKCLWVMPNVNEYNCFDNHCSVMERNVLSLLLLLLLVYLFILTDRGRSIIVWWLSVILDCVKS